VRSGCIDAIVIVIRIAVVIGIAGRSSSQSVTVVVVVGFAWDLHRSAFQRALQRVVFRHNVVVNTIRWIANVSGAAPDVLATAGNDFQRHLPICRRCQTGLRIAVRMSALPLGV